MKVLLLGGYGQFGLPTARQLARYELIDEVVVAGRSLDKAQRAASEVGPKARALRLEADDPDTVAAALDRGDVLVSFMWDEARHQEPLMRAAFRAGAHYCTLRSRPPTPELDRLAREAQVTALVGVGNHPGLQQLIDKLAMGMLDEVDAAVSGLFWAPLQDVWDDIYRAYFKLPGDLDRGPHGRDLRRTLGTATDADERLAAIRDSRAVEMYLMLLSAQPSQQVEIPVMLGSRRGLADPLTDGVDMPLDGPEGGFVSVPALAAQPPEELEGHPGVVRYHLSIAGFSVAFTTLVNDTARRLRDQELNFEEAVATVHGRLAADLEPFLLDPRLFAAMPGSFMSVYGHKEGRPARAATWFPQAFFTERNWLDLTAAPVAIAVARLLRGDIAAPGAHLLTQVDSLDEAYRAELASRLPEVPDDVPIIGSRLEFLDAPDRP